MTREVTFTVPLVAPSVNHYVKHTRSGHHYVTNEAQAFKEAVALCERRQYVAAKEYEVEVKVFLGRKQKGDLDNFGKVCLDSLVAANVIHTDSAVTRLVMEKGRDAKNPRTEFMVRAR